MNPRHTPSELIRDERGITLIEMLVATVSGAVIMMALFAILDFSINQSSRIAEKVDANQTGRVALEKVSLELHSSCVAASVTPVKAGSDDTSIRFISVPGSQAYFPTAKLHYVHLVGEELIDNAYDSTGGGAPSWTFPPLGEAPSSSQVLTSNISQSQAGEPLAPVPLFQYFRYYNAKDPIPVPGTINPTPMTTPLNIEDAAATAEVTVSFTANPTSGSTGTTRSVNFTDSTLLRFNPSSSTANNAACA